MSNVLTLFDITKQKATESVQEQIQISFSNGSDPIVALFPKSGSPETTSMMANYDNVLAIFPVDNLATKQLVYAVCHFYPQNRIVGIFFNHGMFSVW